MTVWKKALGIALLGMACAQAWAIPTLSVTATPASVGPGSKVSVAVNVDDVSDLAAYYFSLGFDASVLKVTDYRLGGFLGSGGADVYDDSGSFDNENGLISLTLGAILSEMSGVSGGGTLAYFTFETLAQGVSGLRLSDASFSDYNYNLIDVALQDGSVSVVASNDVPEPASWMLLAGGALAGGALRRRRKGVRG